MIRKKLNSLRQIQKQVARLVTKTENIKYDLESIKENLVVNKVIQIFLIWKVIHSTTGDICQFNILHMQHNAQSSLSSDYSNYITNITNNVLCYLHLKKKTINLHKVYVHNGVSSGMCKMQILNMNELKAFVRISEKKSVNTI